jgi:hypothetical protein
VLYGAAMHKPAILFISGVALAGVASPALAKPRASSAGPTRSSKKPAPIVVEKTAPKPKLGDSYDLFARRAVKSTRDVSAAAGDDVHIVMQPRGLTARQIERVVIEHSVEIEYCWGRVPQAQRDASCTAMLVLGVEAEGRVTASKITGDAPAAVAKCLAAAAERWQFPVAEATTAVEYPVSMRAL